MKRRIHLRKKININIFNSLRNKKNISKSNFLIITLIFVFLCVILIFNFINKKVSPILLNYAELETKKFANLIINKAISKQMTDDLGIDNLFIITKDDSGQIKTIDFNPILVNKVLSLVTSSIQMNLKYIEEGNIELVELPSNVLIDYDKKKLKKGIVFEIPSGIVLNNSILSNIGPKIPVKLNLVGDIVSNIKTKITNYGINNALLEVSVSVTVTEQVILPFTSKRVNINTDIPVAIKLIQGTIPNYYFNGIDKNSPTLSIPIE